MCKEATTSKQSDEKPNSDSTEKPSIDDPSHSKPTSLFNYEKYLNISKYLRRIGLNDTCSTETCKHTEGCLFNIINATVKGFSLGYAAKTSLSVIGVLINAKKLLKKPSLLLSAFINKEQVRFALFPAVYNFVLHSLQCLMKRKGVNPAIQSFVSGFVAGFIALATRQPKNRAVWSIFLLARGFDCLYRSLCNRGVIRQRGSDYQMIFSFMYILVGYCYACEPENLPVGFNKFLRQVTVENAEDLAARTLWVTKTNNILKAKGCPTHDIAKGLLLNQMKKK